MLTLRRFTAVSGRVSPGKGKIACGQRAPSRVFFESRLFFMTISLDDLPENAQAEFQNIIDEMAQGGRIEASVLAAFLSHNSSAVRKFAVELIEYQNDPAAIPLLLSAVGDEDVEVSLTAVEVVRTFRHPGSIPHLVEALSHDSAEIRLAAVTALRDRRLPAAVEPLLLRIADPEPEVRREAVGALAHYRDYGLMIAVRGALRDSSPAVRRAAAVSLGELPDAVSSEDFRLAAADEDWQVRREVAAVLGKVPGGLSELLLSRLLEDEVWQVVRQALLSLVRVAPGGIEAAVYLSRHSVAELRIAAAEAIVISGKWEHSAEIQRLTSDPDPAVSSAARRALLRLLRIQKEKGGSPP